MHQARIGTVNDIYFMLLPVFALLCARRTMCDTRYKKATTKQIRVLVHVKDDGPNSTQNE